MKHYVYLILFLVSTCAIGQEYSLKAEKKVAIKDSVSVAKTAISSFFFKVVNSNNKIVNPSNYTIDYTDALLVFKQKPVGDSITIKYQKYPDFITKTYQVLDSSLIVSSYNNQERLLRLQQPNTKKEYKPFNGLTTSGSISRGVRIGNNQNSVLNSELDLQISGKLSDKLTLRASIQDSNTPIQNNGYTQQLDQFDQIFVELKSDNWFIRAGDIDLINNTSYFSSFTKRVQGLLVNTNFPGDTNTEVFAAGALVRGQFSSFQITANEGNQGPYKLQGSNGELFVLIVSGSETVYINGQAIKRGESEDYIIDYNAGEIIFNSTFPITSEMRITVDFQYSDRNYSRIIAYGGGSVSDEKFKINATVYSENDSKNNPIQQNLNEEQVTTLSSAGDDKTKMVANSEVPETFNENRILYKKELNNGNEIYVFSNNPNDTLFSVRFTKVGTNKGNYKISTTNTVSKIYQYVPPVGGVPQGDFEPVIQLIAPTKLQIAQINGSYTPSEKTNANFELALTRNDLNLFSNIDDDNNDGVAAHFDLKQIIAKKDSTYQVSTFAHADFIEKTFTNIEGLYQPEFSRDWNLELPNTTGIAHKNQIFTTLGTTLKNTKGQLTYQFDFLNLEKDVTGTKHYLNGAYKTKKWNLETNNSYLSTTEITNISRFLRTNTSGKINFNRSWIGAQFVAEDNLKKNTTTNIISNLSQKFTSVNSFIGIGDQSKTFTEIGYKFRVNDSLQNNRVSRVNKSNTVYLTANAIQNKHTQLNIYANYRILDYEINIPKETSLNSRIQYSQKLAKGFIHANTVYETNSGRLAQQGYTYLKVESGQGVYIWNDYNANKVQELEEFEIAPFQDQANYIRVLLPNQTFLKTHQNKLSQTLTLNPGTWINKDKGTLKMLSKFYNLTSLLINRKTKRDTDKLDLNPFSNNNDLDLSVQSNFRNTIFFNRGKQHYSTSYTYLTNKNSNTLAFGKIENSLKSHQFSFLHKIQESWLTTLNYNLENTISKSENFSNKNFNIKGINAAPKLSYLLTENTHFDVFYKYSNKNNIEGLKETLTQNTFGLAFGFTPKKAEQGTISGEINYIKNTFEGNTNSPVGYQLLEGLQPGKNLTWTLIAQKKLTKYLDLNLNYLGRKTESSKVIHNGSVQLKAYF